jgi:hypothetical protein
MQEQKAVFGLILSILLSSITAGICVFIGLTILNWLGFSSWQEPWHEIGWWGLAAVTGVGAGLSFWKTANDLD